MRNTHLNNAKLTPELKQLAETAEMLAQAPVKEKLNENNKTVS